MSIDIFIAGWWYTYPSEKYESQLGLLFPTEWENKIHVPNHQPDILSVNIFIYVCVLEIIYVMFYRCLVCSW